MQDKDEKDEGMVLSIAKGDIVGKRKEFNILIVEDEDFISSALQEIVRKAFRCKKLSGVRDGQEAWQMLLTDHYDLVISDWNMPKKSGYELLLDIRKNAETRDIAFIMLTARKDKDSVLASVQGGITNYIIKPFKKHVLIEKIEKALSTKAYTHV